MNETPDSLLTTDEPPPFTVDNENGTSPLLIVADHAGKIRRPWFHSVYTAHAASSPDWLRAQRPCLENPTWSHARVTP
jgi:hypothetical protein